MTLITTSRGTVHYHEAAAAPDAPAVILIHGQGGDTGFWTAEQAALSDQFRVIAVDLRGSGQTPGTLTPFTIDDLADDVVALLDALQIQSAHVVGFSLGGLVAQALAVSAPARVRRLVLGGAFPKTNPQALLFLQAVRAVYAEGISAKRMFELVLPWLFSERFLGGPDAAPFLDYPEDDPNEQSRADWLRLLDAQLRFEGVDLARIQAPTLVIGGDEDRLATPSDAQALAGGIADAQLLMLPGGHLMNVESPVAFVDALRRFLAEGAAVR